MNDPCVLSVWRAARFQFPVASRLRFFTRHARIFCLVPPRGPAAARPRPRAPWRVSPVGSHQHHGTTHQARPGGDSQTARATHT